LDIEQILSHCWSWRRCALRWHFSSFVDCCWHWQ